MGIKVTYTFFSLLSCFHFSLVSQVFISIHGVVSSRLFLASCIVRKNFIVLLKKAIQIRKRSEIYSMYLVPFIHCPKSYVVSLLHTHTCGFKAALTHTKWNKVGSALFWNSLPILIQNEHQKKISSLDFRSNSYCAQPIQPWWAGLAMHASL